MKKWFVFHILCFVEHWQPTKVFSWKTGFNNAFLLLLGSISVLSPGNQFAFVCQESSWIHWHTQSPFLKHCSLPHSPKSVFILWHAIGTQFGECCSGPSFLNLGTLSGHPWHLGAGSSLLGAGLSWVSQDAYQRPWIPSTRCQHCLQTPPKSSGGKITPPPRGEWPF